VSESLTVNVREIHVHTKSGLRDEDSGLGIGAFVNKKLIRTA
jgi:hypothetical protein